MARDLLDSRVLRALLARRRDVESPVVAATPNLHCAELSEVQRALDSLPDAVLRHLARVRDETDSLRRKVAEHSRRWRGPDEFP